MEKDTGRDRQDLVSEMNEIGKLRGLVNRGLDGSSPTTSRADMKKTKVEPSSTLQRSAEARSLIEAKYAMLGDPQAHANKMGNWLKYRNTHLGISQHEKAVPGTSKEIEPNLTSKEAKPAVPAPSVETQQQPHARTEDRHNPVHNQPQQLVTPVKEKEKESVISHQAQAHAQAQAQTKPLFDSIYSSARNPLKTLKKGFTTEGAQNLAQSLNSRVRRVSFTSGQTAQASQEAPEDPTFTEIGAAANGTSEFDVASGASGGVDENPKTRQEMYEKKLNSYLQNVVNNPKKGRGSRDLLEKDRKGSVGITDLPAFRRINEIQNSLDETDDIFQVTDGKITEAVEEEKPSPIELIPKKENTFPRRRSYSDPDDLETIGSDTDTVIAYKESDKPAEEVGRDPAEVSRIVRFSLDEMKSRIEIAENNVKALKEDVELRIPAPGEIQSSSQRISDCQTRIDAMMREEAQLRKDIDEMKMSKTMLANSVATVRNRLTSMLERLESLEASGRRLEHKNRIFSERLGDTATYVSLHTKKLQRIDVKLGGILTRNPLLSSASLTSVDLRRYTLLAWLLNFVRFLVWLLLIIPIWVKRIFFSSGDGGDLINIENMFGQAEWDDAREDMDEVLDEDELVYDANDGLEDDEGDNLYEISEKWNEVHNTLVEGPSEQQNRDNRSIATLDPSNTNNLSSLGGDDDMISSIRKREVSQRIVEREEREISSAFTENVGNSAARGDHTWERRGRANAISEFTTESRGENVAGSLGREGTKNTAEAEGESYEDFPMSMDQFKSTPWS